MTFGVLKEQEPENRVVITPEVLGAMVGLKLQVLVEEKAGEKAHFTDSDYTRAGGSIVSRKVLLEKSDVLLRINAFTSEELSPLNKEQIVIASFNPFFNVGVVASLRDKYITSFSMDLLPRTSRAQSMDMLSSMATVSGYKAVLDAAMHLPKFFPMFMSAAGTIKPAKVLILGAGVAGLQSVAIARKLGAVVEVFDVRSAVKGEVESLGGKFIEVEGALEDNQAGGYAIEQTEDFKLKQANLIHNHAVLSDVVICTAQIPGRKAPLLLNKNTVLAMRSGAVIIDLAASGGGNCEVTRNGEILKLNGVTIIGKSDYPSDMPTDASSMYAKNMLNFIKLLIDNEGKLNLNLQDDLIKGACLTHNGIIANERVQSTLQTK